MMAEELGITAGQQNESPFKHGLITFISFLAFGVMPLLGCMFGDRDASLLLHL